MVKIDDFHVEYDKKWSVYNPGDVVTGRVHLRINEKYTCDSIIAHCYGSSRVWWIERQVSPPNGMRSVPFTQEKVYIDEKKKIWQWQDPNQKDVPQKAIKEEGANSQAVDKLLREASNLRLVDLSGGNDKPCLTPGTHEFPFEFTLPEICATSFDASGSYAYIRYFVKVQLKLSEKSKLSTKEHFTVVSPYDLNLNPHSRQAVVKHGQRFCKGGGFLCMHTGGGSIGITLALQKTGYVPGERVIVSAEIDNKSHRFCGFSKLPRFRVHTIIDNIPPQMSFPDHKFSSIRGVKARLIQLTTAYSNLPEPKSMESTNSVAIISTAQKIKKGEMFMWDGLNLLVPAVNPSFVIDGVLEVEYRICIEAMVGKAGPNLTVEAPIIIGTVPILHSSSHGVGYVTYGEPPPTYEESVLGRSVTQDNLNDVTLPRFAVYSNINSSDGAPLIEQ